MRTNRGRVGECLLWGGVAVGEDRRSLGLRCLLSQESRWKACLGDGGYPNFELRSKFTRSAASADRASLKTRHRRVFLTLRALSGSNPLPPPARGGKGLLWAIIRLLGILGKRNGEERGIRMLAFANSRSALWPRAFAPQRPLDAAFRAHALSGVRIPHLIERRSILFS